MSSTDVVVDTSTPVLVLNSGHHGALGITRSLGRLGIAVHLVDVNPRAPSFRSRYCRGSYIWDIDQAPADQSVEYLGRIASELGRPAVLVATSDAGVLFLAQNAGRLRQWFLFPQQSFHLVERLHNKKQMHRLACSAGMPTPDVFFPECKEDLLTFAQNAVFPLIVKAIDSIHARDHGSPISLLIVRTKQELLSGYERMQTPGCPNLMVQEYIPEGKSGSWMFNGYFNAASECLFGFPGRKVRQNPPDAGMTSMGACLPNVKVSEMTKKFIKTISYQGILDIDYVFDTRDGLYKVVDVNPRIGCTFRLFVSDTGMDVARALYFDLTGQTVAPGHCSQDRKWMVEPSDLASSFRDWRGGGLKVSEWARSLRGVEECAYFAADDPYPMLAKCVNYARA